MKRAVDVCIFTSERVRIIHSRNSSDSRPFAHKTQKHHRTSSRPLSPPVMSAFDDAGGLFVSNSNPMMSSTGLPPEGELSP
jgi:hypothetical protein